MKTFIQFCILPLLLFVFTSAQLGPNDRLEVGENAPHFKTKDINGEVLKLQKIFKSHDQTLLVFLRHAWCPICNTRSHELINNYEQLAAQNIAVVVVYESKAESLKRYVDDYQLPYHVIADPEGELYRKYKVERNMKKVVADFQGEEATQQLFEQGKTLYKGSHEDYIAEGEEGSDLIPADFLINQKGKIEFAYYGKYLGDHLSLEQVFDKKTPKGKVQEYVRF